MYDIAAATTRTTRDTLVRSSVNSTATKITEAANVFANPSIRIILTHDTIAATADATNRASISILDFRTP